MERYSHIKNKTKREIVLLKAFPCIWSQCAFCDNIEDNSTNKEEMIALNNEVLDRVRGEYGVLEVIDSASIFELPKENIERIKEIIDEKHIHTLFVESHWLYKDKIQTLRDYFGIKVIVKIGIETFDEHFRNNILNKNVSFESIDELKYYFDSPCLLIGIQGQSKEMIRHDINILTQYFDCGTINIYRNNSTHIKRDENLIHWFMNEYHDLIDDPRYDFLYEPTDFGVGD
ncbi:MAG: radical SAM protein [Erysipelotrichaceae bacterium]|nr:radical SAM protein [Erysipelotrichaceae bacterium]